MIGTTNAGGRIMVFVDRSLGNVVMVGTSLKPRSITSLPLTPKEARNMANWLNGAADEVEREITTGRSKVAEI